MENETIFVDGMIFKSKHKNAPEFVLGSIAIKVDDLTAFLAKHKKADGWVNVDFLRGKPKEGETKGKPYFKLNTFKPEGQGESKPVNASEETRKAPDYPEDEINPEDIPF